MPLVVPVGADRSPYGSSCSCAYSRLPLQPRSSSAALKSPYVIKGKIVCWVLGARCRSKIWSPSRHKHVAGHDQLVGCSWALRVHCVGARCSVQLALLLGFFGVP